MAIFEWINSLVDPVLRPILSINPFLAILLVSLFISLLITLIYKWMTDQELMKTLKQDMKVMQKELKELKQHPKKMMEHQKKIMEKNMKYMMHSLKPTLVTFVPIILIFGWLNAHMSYYPILPGDEFRTTINFEEGVYGNVSLLETPGLEIVSQSQQEISNNKAEWTLKGEEGEYKLEYDLKGKTYTTELVITKDSQYGTPIKNIRDGFVDSIQIEHRKKVVMNLFGWKLGWLGTYIIFSIIFSMGLRKLLKVH